MVKALLHHFNKGKVIAGSEVKLARCRFDVVAYDKNNKLFRIIECKLHSRPVSVGKTFGQAATYFSVLSGRAFDFLDAASKKINMRYGRWMEATHGGKEIALAVYVALTDKATKQPEFWELRAQFPGIGVIRVKPDGRCHDYLRGPDGTADEKTAQALPMKLRL
jgi:hypothetical protein